MLEKRTRTSTFSSAEERDAWLAEQLAVLSRSLAQTQNALQMTQAAITTTEQQRAILESTAQEKRQSIAQRQARLQEYSKQQKELKNKRDELDNARQELYRDEHKIKEARAAKLAEFNTAKQSLTNQASKSTLQAIEELYKLQSEVTGRIYGPLIELVECDDRFQTAAEVSAGNALFHVVVDTDTTASQLIRLINQRKLDGRITFLPLNRLGTGQREYPNEAHTVPLISRLQFQPEVEKAVRQVFGRVLVCQNAQLCTQMVAKYEGLDCITLEGDKVDRRGPVTGGYIDKRSNKLALQRKITQTQKDFDVADIDLRDRQERITAISQEITQVTGHIKTIDVQRQRLLETFEQLEEDKNKTERDMNRLDQEIADKRKTVKQYEAEMGDTNKTMASYQVERGTPLDSQLDEGEAEEVRHSRGRAVDGVVAAVGRKNAHPGSSLFSVHSHHIFAVTFPVLLLFHLCGASCVTLKR